MDLQYFLEMIHKAETTDEAEEHIGAVFNLFREMNDMIEELKHTEMMLQSQVDEMNDRVAELENQ